MNDGNMYSESILRAEGLLRNKGIASDAWQEWKRSVHVLPKHGKKQFEPNGSWLEKHQIEKNIKNCKDLLSVERVERVSQLAIAEWLPDKKRAEVTKRSGQDWGNFGVESNFSLYLIPEEALFLLETNCLELRWNGVPLSVQQAYEILIDGTECTLEEYRVYSQLTRYGYHVQRFLYKYSQKEKECSHARRKVIVNPENGLRMTDSQWKSSNQPKLSLKDTQDLQSNEEYVKTERNINEKKESTSSGQTEKEILNILEGITHTVESMESNKSSKDKMNNNTKSYSSKLEIISEETLLNNIKVVKVTPITENVSPLKWSGSRIQRNVKLLPKRTDKPQFQQGTVECNSKNAEQSTCDKRGATECDRSSQVIKKSKLEVIEISDDEIQEVPVTPTKMEMLNLLPNIASQSIITQKVLRKYIPHGINPQKNVYQYNSEKLQNLSEIDGRLRSNSKQNLRQNDGVTYMERRDAIIPYNQNLHLNVHHSNMYPLHKFFQFPNVYTQNQNILIQENMWRSIFNLMSYRYLQNFNLFRNMFQRNRFPLLPQSNFFMPNAENRFLRSWQQVPQHFQQYAFSQQRFHQSNMAEICERQTSPTNLESRRNRENETNDGRMYRSSFHVLPGTSSWAELKKKWHDEKTIVIDDEESINKDCNEVEVIQQLVSPLVGPKNRGSLIEIYDRIKIIKNAPEKTVRRKRGNFNISYNVYSNTQHYRKGKPGQPMYRMVILRQKDDPFLQPIDLIRLYQDANGSPIMVAHVSMSISYIQPGFVTIPYLS